MAAPLPQREVSPRSLPSFRTLGRSRSIVSESCSLIRLLRFPERSNILLNSISNWGCNLFVRVGDILLPSRSDRRMFSGTEFRKISRVPSAVVDGGRHYVSQASPTCAEPMAHLRHAVASVALLTVSG